MIVTNDRVENPLKVGGNARGQRCKDNHYEVLTKSAQNFTQFAFDHYEGMLGTLCRQALMRILRRG